MKTYLIISVCTCSQLLAQSPPGVTQSLPAVVGSGYLLPTPNLAPGQLVTLTVELGIGNDLKPTSQAPAGANLPNTLGDFVFGFQQFVGLNYSLPILKAQPILNCSSPDYFPYTCNELAAVTVQIPFEAQSVLPQAAPPASTGGAPLIGVGLMSQANAQTPTLSVVILADQVHIVTTCDPFMSNANYPPILTGLPCPQIVTHANGTTVSVNNPAKTGEELVAYAVGLGQTNPASVTGQLVTISAPTAIAFTLDYNFHPNALASRPLPTGPQPIYAGTTAGYVGLYQVNFMVPSIPAGTPPCVDATNLPTGANVVQSNLTISIGGQYSFDGARICVATN